MKKSRMPYLLMSLLSLVMIQCSNENIKIKPTIEHLASNYPNILDIKGIPDSATDRSVFIFSDLGAWHGFALPSDKNKKYRGSFVGPFLMTQDNGVWISKAISVMEVMDLENKVKIDLEKAEIVENDSYPNKLRQVIKPLNTSLLIELELMFVSDRTSLIGVNLINNGEGENIRIGLQWSGNSILEGVSFSKVSGGINLSFEKNDNIGWISSSDLSEANIVVNDDGYTLSGENFLLLPGENKKTYLTHTFCFSEEEFETEKTLIRNVFIDPQKYYSRNIESWDIQIKDVINALNSNFKDEPYERIAIKCLKTLNNNYRSPAGFLKHAGLFPSYNYKWFHGFWAWDSWKHAVALANYNPELAKDQIRAMYDFQDSLGMVADCVYRDTIIENHNWRDTKPPLSAWAIWEVYKKSKDVEFLEEIFPKVEKYHQWWYQYRDNDQNGLCEYGSTDGTLIAAKWESGMDNAVRFDNTKIVRNNEYSWSMNRESVDLNSYLFSEKEYLSKIADALGYSIKSAQYSKDADNLRSKIQTMFFDERTGWFYDIDLDDKKQLKDLGSEGWIPLWAGAATAEQAVRVRETMTDTSKFATFIPFPTLAADHERFKPDRGYWRGPVWLDQAYFAIQGLRNYGFKNDALLYTNHIFDRLEGLKNDNGPIWENYHPHSGKGMESKHFSWSAAHILMLLVEE